MAPLIFLGLGALGAWALFSATGDSSPEGVVVPPPGARGLSLDPADYRPSLAEKGTADEKGHYGLMMASPLSYTLGEIGEFHEHLVSAGYPYEADLLAANWQLWADQFDPAGGDFHDLTSGRFRGSKVPAFDPSVFGPLRHSGAVRPPGGPAPAPAPSPSPGADKAPEAATPEAQSPGQPEPGAVGGGGIDPMAPPPNMSSEQFVEWQQAVERLQAS